jgi:predicted nucleotidyltransferase
MRDAVRQLAAQLGKRGGSVTSERKAAAARANGAKGGRPRVARGEPAGGQNWLTLAERKRRKREAYARSVHRLRALLSTYAATHGGAFLLYGSAARGDFRFDSDVDILLRFPRRIERNAWQFAEEACRELQLRPDIRPARLCDEAFVRKVAQYAEALHG